MSEQSPRHLDDAPVAWIGESSDLEDEAALVRGVIVEDHVVRYGALVRELAHRLYALDAAEVGGAADLGLFRGWYLAVARGALARLEGTLIRVGLPPSASQKAG